MKRFWRSYNVFHNCIVCIYSATKVSVTTWRKNKVREDGKPRNVTGVRGKRVHVEGLQSHFLGAVCYNTEWDSRHVSTWSVSRLLLLTMIPFEFRSAGDVHIVVSGLLCRSTRRCEGKIPRDKQSKEVEIIFWAVEGKLQAAGRNTRSYLQTWGCLHLCFFRHGDITSEERAEGV